MLIPDCSPKEFKRAADRALKRLEREGAQPPFPLLLEALAAFYDQRDWNTLCASLQGGAAGRAPAGATVTAKASLTVRPDRTLNLDLDDVGFLRVEGSDPSPLVRASGQGVELVLAAPGNFKSVMMGAASLAFWAQAVRRGEKPRLAIIDSGSAPCSIIDCLKQCGASAAQMPVRKARSHAVNPFDTPLGCRRPTPQGRALLVHLLRALFELVPDGRHSQTAELARIAVDEAYATFWDGASRERYYDEGGDRRVDEAIHRYGIRIPVGTTWWNIVDRLFMAGATEAAALAQRHAVPNLSDIPSVLDSPRMRDMFEKARSPDGSSILKKAIGAVSVALKMFPILQMPTQVDPDGEDVVYVDVGAMAPRGGWHTAWHSAAAFLVARCVVARDFFDTEAELQDVPEDYQGYHEARIRSVRASPRRLVLDNLHVLPVGAARDRISMDMRASGEARINLVLGTMLPDVLPKESAELVETSWILGVPRETDAVKIRELVGISTDALKAMEDALLGPSPPGVTCLVATREDGIRTESVVGLNASKRLLWALASSRTDARLRQEVAKAIGYGEALSRLAERFPTVTARAQLLQETEGSGAGSRKTHDEVVSLLAAAIASGEADPKPRPSVAGKR